jgi:hypothetical protein
LIATPTGSRRKIFRNRLVLLFESDLAMIQLRFSISISVIRSEKISLICSYQII